MIRPVAAAAVLALTQLASTAGAQAPDADQQQMMMQGLQAMQECMANLDMDAMERMNTEAEAMNAEVKSLCAAGKRDEAQDKAMAFGLKMAKDPNMKAMAECGKKAQGMMPQMQHGSGAPTAEELKNRHVCDQE